MHEAPRPRAAPHIPVPWRCEPLVVHAHIAAKVSAGGRSFPRTVGGAPCPQGSWAGGFLDRRAGEVCGEGTGLELFTLNIKHL